MRRALLPFALVVVLLSGCDVTDASPYAAVISVSPTVIRTIHYFDTDRRIDRLGVPTDLPVDQIDCLRPGGLRGCSIDEVVLATIFNTGVRDLHWQEWCNWPLQRLVDGVWIRDGGYPCAAPAGHSLPIHPGHSITLPVSILRSGGTEKQVRWPAGEYRVRFDLWDGARWVPDEALSLMTFRLE